MAKYNAGWYHPRTDVYFPKIVKTEVVTLPRFPSLVITDQGVSIQHVPHQ